MDSRSYAAAESENIDPNKVRGYTDTEIKNAFFSAMAQAFRQGQRVGPDTPPSYAIVKETEFADKSVSCRIEVSTYDEGRTIFTLYYGGESQPWFRADSIDEILFKVNSHKLFLDYVYIGGVCVFRWQ